MSDPKPQSEPGSDIISDTQVMAWLMAEQDAIEDQLFREAWKKVLARGWQELAWYPEPQVDIEDRRRKP
jgi:hypothetical protein